MAEFRALWAGLGSNATLQILGLDGTGWTDEGFGRTRVFKSPALAA